VGGALAACILQLAPEGAGSKGAVRAEEEGRCYANGVSSARLSPQERIVLADFAARVRGLLGARLGSLILFGSRARGEGRGDSDIDVLVLVEKMTRIDRRTIQDIGADLSVASDLVLSPLVTDAARWRDDLPLGRAVASEGIAL
jgi:predicted nucleotidyltransferase